MRVDPVTHRPVSIAYVTGLVTSSVKNEPLHAMETAYVRRRASLSLLGVGST